MQFRILGSLEVSRDARAVVLPRGKPRALLAVLLLHRNEVVSFDRLVEDLWEGDRPSSARQMVKGYVSDLRRALGGGGSADCLVTHSPGYRLEAAREQVDAEIFERLVANGGRALASERYVEAADQLSDALALWRGSALADFTYERFAEDSIRRLEDLRLVALEQRIAADLELGRHAHLVGELAELLRAHPLRERLCELQMLALYRADRGADALETFSATRAALDEIGLEPGPALRALQQAILRHDPEIRSARRVVADQAVELLPADLEPEAPPVVEERRKTVTVLFCDLVDSTALGDRLDPEVHRDVLKRYFALASRVLHRHGGSVEKFIGDAVMAVFGVPTVHEDDAMRAVRAAFELRAELGTLNDELDAAAGEALDIRIGINTGEVMAGDPSAGDMLVTGDTVNLAARLEQSAQPNEIMLGEATLELVRGAVGVEETAPFAVKGKTAPVRASRLVRLTGGAPAYTRRFDAPLVGRQHELLQLRHAYARCSTGNSATLFTVLGPAGIGKSRLAAEIQLELDGEARVVRGACLPYGEGITFRPLREMLVQALGEPLDERVVDLVEHPQDREWIARSVTRLVGLDEDSGGSLEESFLAVRRVLERLAYEQPLVLVFEDVHWAEPGLLELIEHVAELARDSPIFLLCIARPDLLERRPSWAGGKPNATTLLLDPLSPEEAARLADWLLRESVLDARARERALELAEGNPLFLEQLCAYATQQRSEAASTIPPATIRALLAARVDSLGPADRALVERAAIVGTEFDLASITELVPTALRPSVAARLDVLVRKDLLRPSRATGEPRAEYRFRHVLIRDAAYRSIGKGQRAELHEHFAYWLERSRGDDEFCDELVGHHLEQAHRYRVELRRLGADTTALAHRASARLETAGRRAQARNDGAAAAGLLERAATLLPDEEPRRVRLLADVAATATERGDLARAAKALQTAESYAAPLRDSGIEARLSVETQLLELSLSTSSATAAAAKVARAAVPVLERVDDQRGLARAWRLAAHSEWVRAHAAAAAAAWERAADHARRADDEYERADLLSWIASALWLGPAPATEAIDRCEQILADVRGHLVAEVDVAQSLGGLHGFIGHFEVARSYFALARSMLEELGLGLHSGISHHEVIVEMLDENYEYAEQRLRADYERLDALGETSLRSTTAALLARATLGQGALVEAERFATVSEQLTPPDDVLTQMLWRGVRARLLAEAGSFDAAEHIGREATALAATTDLTSFHADALVDLAAVLQARGEGVAATAVLGQAVDLYDEKGNAPGGARARSLDTRFAI